MAPKRNVVLPAAPSFASFAEQLRAKTEAAGTTKMSKVVADVKQGCSAAAAKGHSKVDGYIHDFIGDIGEVRVELELLDLRVKELGMINTSLNYEVSWSDERPAKRPRLAGNVQLSCGVCTALGPVQRLHPCGHLLGSCCLSVAVGKKCPFCRDEVSLAQAIFNP